MRSQNFNSDSYNVGGRHRSDTKCFHGEITSKGNEVLLVHCSVCNRKKIYDC